MGCVYPHARPEAPRMRVHVTLPNRLLRHKLRDVRQHELKQTAKLEKVKAGQFKRVVIHKLRSLQDVE